MMKFCCRYAGDAVAYNTVAKTMDREGGGTARFSSVLMAEVMSWADQCSAENM